MENDNSKTLTEISAEDHTDCLKITNVSTSGDYLDTLFFINLNEFIRDADGNIRRLAQPCLPAQSSNPEDDEARTAD